MSIAMKHTSLALAAALALIACEGASSKTPEQTDAAGNDEDSGAAVDTPPGGDSGAAGDDAGSAQAGEDAGSEVEASDCYTDPKTYDEIINACTDAEKIDKKPALPLLLADGGLPDLP